METYITITSPRLFIFANNDVALTFFTKLCISKDQYVGVKHMTSYKCMTQSTNSMHDFWMARKAFMMTPAV